MQGGLWVVCRSVDGPVGWSVVHDVGVSAFCWSDGRSVNNRPICQRFLSSKTRLPVHTIRIPVLFVGRSVSPSVSGMLVDLPVIWSPSIGLLATCLPVCFVCRFFSSVTMSACFSVHLPVCVVYYLRYLYRRANARISVAFCVGTSFLFLIVKHVCLLLSVQACKRNASRSCLCSDLVYFLSVYHREVVIVRSPPRGLGTCDRVVCYGFIYKMVFLFCTWHSSLKVLLFHLYATA